MQCPKCKASVQIGDRFCEECGAPLTTPRLSPIISQGCSKCGAQAEAIDAEGYCSYCGFRNDIQNSDRIEINLQPHLGGVSDRGLKHRSNEDYLTCAEIREKNAFILVVCDGVSSSQSPELAAKAAAEGACQALMATVEREKTPCSHSWQEGMKQAIASAQMAVCAVPYRDVEDPPSTTIIAAVVQNGIATIGWLGDSRAYWISSQGAKLLTQDDSWLNDMIASGEMTEQEAINSAKAHVITRWLGADVEKDPEPSLITFEIPGSGYLLLCTDGFWNYAPEAEQIAQLLEPSAGKESVVIARNLVEFALSQGGRDNITVSLFSL